MDFGSAMSLRFYHVLVLQFRFLHGFPLSELVMRQKSTSTPDVFLMGTTNFAVHEFLWWLYYWITFWNGSVYNGVAT